MDMPKCSVVVGNIVDCEVDAIVNAANTSLLGGGGVDGAIHRAAGPELAAECRLLNGCKVGEAKLTKGYRLRAPFVIHTVGPVWRGGQFDESILLTSCYRQSMEIAIKQGIASLAFPAISTGRYRFPPDLAAQIAVSAVNDFGKDAPEVVFCCFDEASSEPYRALLQ
jgi:O-acetyl-ADP-ribose deacetylase (regulator of RNase III)